MLTALQVLSAISFKHHLQQRLPVYAQLAAKQLIGHIFSMQDATVYKSYIKYPNDLKLRWACLQWLRSQMEKVGKLTQSALPRSKYEPRLKRYIAFSKRRKKTHKLERKAVLYFVG